jgi:chemotaxis protein MotB
MFVHIKEKFNLMKELSVMTLCVLLMASCVSKKKFAALEEDSRSRISQMEASLNDCNNNVSGLEGQVSTLETRLAQANTDLDNANNKNADLQDQVDFLKENNTNLLDRLSDLSVVSKAGAESIKASLETMNRQNAYIQDLNTSIRQKDSLNLALVMKLKRSLADINDQDIQIEVKKGVVYVSLSDKLLFKSGSAVITQRADEVLGKIASVVNDHSDFDILVEGHTDNVPISNDCVTDNWDLSVKRATSVVRTLQTKYDVSPARMTAGGRGEFVPKASNEDASGRSENRRTEILIMPKLEEFFDLLAEPAPEADTGNE